MPSSQHHVLPLSHILPHNHVLLLMTPCCHDVIAIIRTSDQSCWLAEACKFLLLTCHTTVHNDMIAQCLMAYTLSHDYTMSRYSFDHPNQAPTGHGHLSTAFG